MLRHKTRPVRVGGVIIGGSAPISVQSMTKTLTEDVKATVRQIKELEDAGCQIIRVAVPDEKSARALKDIKKQIKLPLVADIHFNYRLALMAVDAGVDKLRINPGNIGAAERVKAVVKAAQKRRIPIRIGVNSGSLEKDIKQKYGEVTAEAMVESALRHVKILEDLDFEDIVISLKATSVPMTIEAYKLLASQVDYPLHVGITEAGPSSTGIIKSAVGIGALLSHGIGDTIRVSLTAEPVEEVRVAREILKALELRKEGVTIISCPTCGRADIDVVKLTAEIEKRTRDIKRPIVVALMGCAVNGPGEAQDAEVGLAGGRGEGLIFREGEVVGKVKEIEMVEALLAEIKKVLKGE